MIGDCDCDIKEHGGDENTRFNRNLDFQSVILEGTVMAEFYPTTFLEDDPEDVQGRLRPYGLIGLGMFHFNPQGSLSSKEAMRFGMICGRCIRKVRDG